MFLDKNFQHVRKGLENTPGTQPVGTITILDAPKQFAFAPDEDGDEQHGTGSQDCPANGKADHLYPCRWKSPTSKDSIQPLGQENNRITKKAHRTSLPPGDCFFKPIPTPPCARHKSVPPVKWQ